MIKKVKLSDLKFYEKNAKDHPSWQIEKIKKSILSFGFRGGVKVCEDLTIIIGHGRVLALKELGCEDVDVEVIEDLKPSDIKAYRIADNKTAESEWLTDLLKADLLELKADDYDLTRTGFSEFEIENFFKDGLDYSDEDKLENNDNELTTSECFISFKCDKSVYFEKIKDVLESNNITHNFKER